MYETMLHPFGSRHKPAEHSHARCSPDQCDVEPSCNKAKWKPELEAYNKRVDEKARINIALS